jgi:hypothetical protein
MKCDIYIDDDEDDQLRSVCSDFVSDFVSCFSSTFETSFFPSAYYSCLGRGWIKLKTGIVVPIKETL